MHTEGREGELLIALAQTRNELARAEASTREWLSVVEQLRENLNATLLERDALKESLAAARRECEAMRSVINGMRATYCFHTCPVDAPHEATCMDAAALAAPAAGEEGK